jgi:pyridoxal phosphate enzyme (YggS family)
MDERAAAQSEERACQERLDGVLAAIERGAAVSGRPATAVTLVVVTKKQPISLVQAVAARLLDRGVPVVCGESYVQELASKRAAFPAQGEIHLIGPLQSNKVRAAVELSDVIESVHSRKVLDLVAASAQRYQKRQRVFLQVNISADPRKVGFSEDQVADLLNEPGWPRDGVELEGLMTITALYDQPAQARPDFRRLAEVRQRLQEAGLHRLFRHETIKLSMGMSADFEVALEEGADLVRVGSAIFGER